MRLGYLSLALMTALLPSCAATAKQLPVPELKADAPLTLVWSGPYTDKAETTISDQKTITHFLEFVRSHNDGWREPWDTFPSPQYSLQIKRANELILVVWLGPNWMGGREGTADSSSNRLRNLSDQEQAELHRILGIQKK